MFTLLIQANLFVEFFEVFHRSAEQGWIVRWHIFWLGKRGPKQLHKGDAVQASGQHFLIHPAIFFLYIRPLQKAVLKKCGK
jgi:hypothetical protein